MNNKEIEMEKLNWDKVNQLIPAIIQDSHTLQVLMMGYMSKEALQKTYETRKVTFYSRMKKRLWTKGETSGNELTLVDILPDCDGDTLLVLATPSGPSCHLNTQSCFGTDGAVIGIGILAKLAALVEQRYVERPANSYVARLFEEGGHRIAQKVGEEGVEVALASVIGSKENIINEVADLFFHLLILLKQCHINLTDVWLELHKRMNQLNP
jgi:phosphoribosyl-ATP pyrophosphohydrolase/phosphoribosyl-AMP cyclohydrolase